MNNEDSNTGIKRRPQPLNKQTKKKERGGRDKNIVIDQKIKKKKKDINNTRMLLIGFQA